MVAMGDAQKAAFARPDWGRIDYPVPPITVGALTRMVTLRRSIADGTAKPESIAQFEKTSQERQKMLESAVGITADRIIENREKKLIIAGMWAAIYQVAKAVRDKGYGTKDFNPDNCLFVAGGLKGAVLPLDYQEFVHETFNFPANRRFQTYSMQEINTGMPKCPAGRYHVPPWLVPLVLNKDGDTLLPQAAGEYEGRAAFFDIVLDGRWGGVISGDKISIDFGPCKCGAKGPSIRDNIARYKDLEGDDKIACSGTVDAYVRGVA
jgi:hypothetical protein